MTISIKSRLICFSFGYIKKHNILKLSKTIESLITFVYIYRIINQKGASLEILNLNFET